MSRLSIVGEVSCIFPDVYLGIPDAPAAAHHAALHERPTIKQPVFTSNRLTTSTPQAGPSKPSTYSRTASPVASGPSRLSSALHKARQIEPSLDPTDFGDGADNDTPGKSGKKRDDLDMTVIENLTLGPKDYGLDTLGGEEWRWTEPNSGINLK